MIIKNENYRKYILVFMWGVLVALCLFRFAEPMKDGDVFWHIKYGEFHVQNKTMLMDHSIFSWTQAEKYGPYCTWAADVLVYFMFQAGGWPLLYVFMYLCLFLPVFTAGTFARKAGVASYGFTFFILIILQLAVDDASYIKPEILSLAFFVSTALLYFNLKIDRLDEKKGLLFLFYPLIFLLWANMHGVFFIGLALLAAIIAGEMINFLIKCKHAFPKRTVFILMISGILSAAATLLTPYGTDLIVHLLNFSNQGVAPSVVSNIRAFQSVAENIWIHAVEYKLEYWGIMVVSFLILFLTNAKKNRELDFGILLPTILLALFNLKYLRASFYWPPFWALSIFYLSGKGRVDLESALRDAKPVMRRGLVVVMACLAIFFPLRVLESHIRRPLRFNYIGYGFSYGLPVQESAFLKKYNFGTKLFNSYNAGSYLLFDLFPSRKVFIDNRLFPYKGYIYEKYLAFRDGQISLKEMESEFGFDTAVINNHEIVLSQFLESENWRVVFYGIGGVVLVNQDVDFTYDITKLDRHRFDGLKNMVQAATIIRTAQNLNDLDTADYVLDIMQKNLSYQGAYDFFYSYCTSGQKGLRAFSQGDYVGAYDYLRQVGFNESNIRINKALRTAINYKINACMNAGKYHDALALIGRMLNYYRDDADVIYNAGVIAYMASKQAENAGVAVKLPGWRNALGKLLEMRPDHPYADIARKLLSDGTFAGKLPLKLDSFGGIK